MTRFNSSNYQEINYKSLKNTVVGSNQFIWLIIKKTLSVLNMSIVNCNMYLLNSLVCTILMIHCFSYFHFQILHTNCRKLKSDKSPVLSSPFMMSYKVKNKIRTNIEWDWEKLHKKKISTDADRLFPIPWHKPKENWSRRDGCCKHIWPLLMLTFFFFFQLPPLSFFFSVRCFSPTLGGPRKLIFGLDGILPLIKAVNV